MEKGCCVEHACWRTLGMKCSVPEERPLRGGCEGAILRQGHPLGKCSLWRSPT